MPAAAAPGNAFNTVNVTGNLVVQGPVLVDIEDTGFNQSDPLNFIAGGHIGGNAHRYTQCAKYNDLFDCFRQSGTMRLMALAATIESDGSVLIGGDAIVKVSADQNISALGSALFWIANGNFMGFGGGTIGGDAQVNVGAVDISTGDLFAEIFNYGGASIGGSASINFNLTGDLTTHGNALFRILTLGGGNIGGNGAINVSAANITANSLLAEINNSNAGMIGGAANVAVNIDNNVTAPSGFTLQILNGNSGHIVSGADVLYSAGGMLRPPI